MEPGKRSEGPVGSAVLILIPLLIAFQWRVRVGPGSLVLAELCLPLALVGVLLNIGSPRLAAPPRRTILIALALALSAFFSVFVQADFKHALSAYRDLMLPVGFYLAFSSLRLLPKQVIGLAKAAVVWASVTAVLGIIQFVTDGLLWFQDPDFETWQELKTGLIADSRIGQLLGVSHTLPTGAYPHTNGFAEFMVIPILVALALSLRSARNGFARYFWAALAILQTVALVFTVSRGSVMTLLASALLFSVALARKKGVRVMRMLGSLAVVVFLGVTVIANDTLSFDEFGTFLGRIDMWKAGLSVILVNPAFLLTGGLTEGYLQLFPFGQLIHNLLLYLTLQFGAIAAVAWTALVAMGLWHTRSVRLREDGELRNIGTAVSIGLFVTVFFYAQTAPMIDSVQAGLWLFFWLGISQQLASEAQPSALPDDSEETARYLPQFTEGAVPSV